jgi:hypothetical protein
MKLKLIAIICAISILTITSVSCVSQSTYEILETKYYNIQSQLDDIQSQLDDTKSQLDDTKSQLEQSQKSLEQSNDALKLYQEMGIIVYEGITPRVNTSLLLISDLELQRNSNTHNPTYSELLNFLQSDITDQEYYGLNLCGWFAQQIFNNAERNGINAAFVIVDFEQGVGHALNAFNTTDKGLVFIDCTGENIFNLKLIPLYSVTIGNTPSCDKVAYLEKGMPMGLITLGLNYGLAYSDFNQWEKDVASMRFKFHTALTNDKLYELEKESDTKLGSFWECLTTPDNIVAKIRIYW